MQLIFLVIAFYILLGAAGMALANRKATAAVARDRWLKFGTYILITSLVLASILYRFFSILAILMILTGYYELSRTLHVRRVWVVFVFFTLIAAGFLFFAFRFDRSFQFFLYFQVLSFDAFCQIAGQLFGRTKLAPRISPSKTLEGLAGGSLACLLSSIMVSGYMDITVGLAIYLGVATSLTALTGDMLASYYKRLAGIKDYSNLLPGQGGVLDRFDSFLTTAFFYVLLSGFFYLPGWPLFQNLING